MGGGLGEVLTPETYLSILLPDQTWRLYSIRRCYFWYSYCIWFVILAVDQRHLLKPCPRYHRRRTKMELLLAFNTVIDVLGTSRWTCKAQIGRANYLFYLRAWQVCWNSGERHLIHDTVIFSRKLEDSSTIFRRNTTCGTTSISALLACGCAHHLQLIRTCRVCGRRTWRTCPITKPISTRSCSSKATSLFILLVARSLW